MVFRIFFGAALIMLILTACAQPKNDYSDEVGANVMEIALFRFSNEAYLFQLDNDILKATQGRRQGDIEDDDFIEKERYDQVRLSEDQCSELWSLAEQVESPNQQEKWFFDVWQIEAIIGELKYESTYGASKDKELDELVAKLIELSPIEIVSSSGQKVIPVNRPN